MSAKLDLFIERMQGDWDFISNVLDDPAGAIQAFGLSGAEADALLAQDFDALVRMGVDGSDIVAAFSGAHSRQCTEK